MKFTETPLPGAYFIDLDGHHDERGFFARMFCEREFAEQGLATRLVQVSDSLSLERGTLRGLHYQLEPRSEVKLIRCIRGSLFDVIVDLRLESEAFGQHLEIELSATERRTLYVPSGFAHGYITLEAETEVLYLIDEYHEPESGRGLRWDDPRFEIAWPMKPKVISDRDATWPDFEAERDLPTPK